MESNAQQEQNPMVGRPQQEHRWLQRLVGEWTFEAEAREPGQPPHRSTGTERVRPLGDLWVLLWGETEMEGVGAGNTLLTIGYDPARGRYVGSWVGSMMTHLFVYEGAVEEGGRRLVLETEGPSFADPSKLSRYRDTIEWQDENNRLLRSSALGADGQWQEFMVAHYRRVK